MRQPMPSRRRCAGAIAGAAGLGLASTLVALPAAAQEYGVYLRCKGQAVANGKSLPAHVDIALRRNSQLALLQSSDILPAGQKMHLEITPQFYTMAYRAPLPGGLAYYDWWHGALIVWNPYLKLIHTIRISVDRQTAALEGDMLNNAGESIGKLAMQCDPSDNETVAPPKF